MDTREMERGSHPLPLAIKMGEASCTAFFDPITLAVHGDPRVSGPTPDRNLQRIGFEELAWEGRTRLTGTARLNWSVFPADMSSQADTAVRGPLTPSPFEAVDLDLIEGPGVAARPSQRLQALAFWWVQDAASAPAALKVSANGSLRALPVSTVRGFTSSASMRWSESALGFAAIPYRDLEGLADSAGIVELNLLDGERVEGQIVFDAVGRCVRRSSLRLASDRDLLRRMDVADVAWQTRVDVFLFPNFCTNNHPVRMPHEALPARGVVRYGDVKKELFHGSGVAFSVSPTVAAASLWALMPTEAELPRSAQIQIGGESMDVSVAVQRSFVSFTSNLIGPLVLATAMVPLSAIEAACERVRMRASAHSRA